MKKFIIKTMITTFLCIFVCTLLSAISYYNIRNNTSFKFPQNKHIVVIGASNTECAINDIILQQWQNCSQSGMHFFYAYIRLKKIIADNPQIDTVVLGITYVSFSSGLDNRWLFDKSKIDGSRNILCFENIDNTLFMKESYFLFSIYRPSKNPKLYIYRQNYKSLGLGAYIYLKRDKLDIDIKKAIDEKQVNIEDSQIASYYNYEYFCKIVSYLKSKNIKLVLLDTPTYKDELYFPEMRKTTYNMLQKTNDTLFIADYHNFMLSDSCYGDIKHLNYRGAKIFSEYIRDNGLKVTDTIYPQK